MTLDWTDNEPGSRMSGQAAPLVEAGASFSLFEEIQYSADAWEIAQKFSALPGLLFLDSALPGSDVGRYSFVVADPFEWVVSRGCSVSINGTQVAATDPLRVLDERLASYCSSPIDGLPPFQGGAAGLFGYDLCHHFERLPRSRIDEFELPELVVGLYDWVLAFDHLHGKTWLISTGLPETDVSRRRRRALDRQKFVQRLLNEPADNKTLSIRTRPAPVIQPGPAFPIPGRGKWVSNFRRSEYLVAAHRILEYIRAGDCFQVNLAQRLAHPFGAQPLELYGRLRRQNPAPFACFFDAGTFAIASVSPECFLRVRDGWVETRPIKGTRPRKEPPGENQALIAELQHSAKDRSENIMIVDLLRNDLGRVCEYGTVSVPQLCQIESFPFVHHLVSVVRGKLRAECGPSALIRAAFPGGSVTGAPKIRALEIIAELEPNARGPYCGSVGYIGFDGRMDSNILIRTCMLSHGWGRVSVGGGIVADSDPEQEYAETWAKAEGMLHAFDDSLKPK